MSTETTAAPAPPHRLYLDQYGVDIRQRRVLYVDDIAAALEVKPATVRSYYNRPGQGRFPPPDERVTDRQHVRPAWYPATFLEWVAQRPGPGRWGRSR